MEKKVLWIFCVTSSIEGMGSIGLEDAALKRTGVLVEKLLVLEMVAAFETCNLVGLKDLDTTRVTNFPENISIIRIEKKVEREKFGVVMKKNHFSTPKFK